MAIARPLNELKCKMIIMEENFVVKFSYVTATIYSRTKTKYAVSIFFKLIWGPNIYVVGHRADAFFHITLGTISQGEIDTQWATTSGNTLIRPN